MGNKRKYLVYTIFTFSVIYGVWFHFFQDDNQTKPNPPGITPITVQSVNNEDNTINIPNDPVPHLAAIEPLSPPDKWGRDPFMAHNTGEIVYNEHTESKTAGEPRLTGISYHQDRASFAIINNKVLQVSDKVDGWQIMSIYNEYVLIRKSGITKTLMMGETL